MYMKGIGVQKDAKKSFDLILSSAERNYSKAQYLVGKFYLEGSGVAKNLDLGKEWLTRAAKQGNDKAKFKLTTLNAPPIHNIFPGDTQFMQFFSHFLGAGHQCDDLTHNHNEEEEEDAFEFEEEYDEDL